MFSQKHCRHDTNTTHVYGFSVDESMQLELSELRDVYEMCRNKLKFKTDFALTKKEEHFDLFRKLTEMSSDSLLAKTQHKSHPDQPTITVLL